MGNTAIKILLIEPSPKIQTSIKKVLDRTFNSGVVLRSVDGVPQSLHQLQNHDYDIILLSLQSPSEIDPAALKSIVNNEKSVPVIVVATSLDNSQRTKLFESGIYDCIIRSDFLTATVRHVFNSTRARKNVKLSGNQPTISPQTVIDSLTNSAMIVDIDGKILLANRKLYSRLQYPLGTLPGKNIFIDLPNSSEPQYREIFQETIQSKQPKLFETTRNSQKLSVVLHPVIDSAQQVESVIIFVSDITDTKKLEEDLYNRDSIFQLISNNVSDVIWTMDLEGHFTYISPSVTRLRGYLPDEAVHLSFEETFTPASAEYATSIMYDVIDRVRTHRPLKTQFIELEQICKDGSTVWTEVSINFLTNKNGLPIGVIGVTRDISERRINEQKLNQLSERLRLATAAAKVGIWDYDLIANRLDWDEQMQHLYGLTPGSFGGTFDSWVNAIHPDDRDFALKRLRQSLSGESEYNTEFRIIWSDQSVHFIKAFATIQRDAEGKPIRILGTNWDITDLKQTEEELFQSNQKLQFILDNIPQRVFWKDRNLTYVGCNRFCAEDAGLSDASEIAGKTDFDLSWKQFGEAFRETDRCVLESGIPRLNSEEMNVLEDGTEVWVNINKIPLLDREGKLQGLLGTFEDISERKHTERELFRSRQMLQFVLDNVPQRIFWKDRNLNYLGCNTKFAIDAGFSKPEEIVGKSDFDLFGINTAKSFHMNDLAVIDSGVARLNYQESNIHSDGSPSWSRTSKIPLFDRDGTIIGLLGTYEDITEQKRIEIEREELISMLQKALGEISTLSGLLPICSSCKKIRDDKGYWTQLEVFISNHTEAEFTHGLCPDCLERLYPDIEIPHD